MAFCRGLCHYLDSMGVGAIKACRDDGFDCFGFVDGDYFGFWGLASACYGDEIQADIGVVVLVAVYF